MPPMTSTPQGTEAQFTTDPHCPHGTPAAFSARPWLTSPHVVACAGSSCLAERVAELAARHGVYTVLVTVLRPGDVVPVERPAEPTEENAR